MSPHKMLIASRDRYGKASGVTIVERPKPVAKGNQVLVRIHATSLNSADFDQLHGSIFARIGHPFKLGFRVLGSDIAGVVEAVGDSVTTFAPGDAVLADLTEEGFGAFAEYCLVDAAALTLKPESISFTDAAALASAGVIAYQACVHTREIHKGDNVLINGAGGGMGTIVLQLAKMAGARVTAIDSKKKLEQVKALGADEVYDYRSVNYIDLKETFDRIIDCQAHFSAKAHLKVLNESGLHLTIGGPLKAIFSAFVSGRRLSKDRSQHIGLLLGKFNDKESLEALLSLHEAGQVKPVVDCIYPFREMRQAMEKFERNDFVGKIVVQMIEEESGIHESH